MRERSYPEQYSSASVCAEAGSASMSLLMVSAMVNV